MRIELVLYIIVIDGYSNNQTKHDVAENLALYDGDGCTNYPNNNYVDSRIVVEMGA